MKKFEVGDLYYNDERYQELCALNQISGYERSLNPADIILPPGYKAEVFMEGLDSPSDMLFINETTMLIADSGLSSGNGKVYRLQNGELALLAENFYPPLNGIAYRNGNTYVSHRGFITVVRENGTREDIISGLPSYGDFSNNNIVFGPDNKIYFGIGTATNSGVVGLDNTWIYNYPMFQDYPGGFILLSGQNFATRNAFSSGEEIVYTGAFSPYGIPNMPFELRKGITKATGCILRANPDGTDLEQVAWGLRNPARIRFDPTNQLFAANHGFDYRGSRPIVNSPDELHNILENMWYGWPDYTAGEPVTLPRFTPSGRAPSEFLLTNHPNVVPRPFAIFPPQSTIMGFDFNRFETFGNIGDIYIAEFGRSELQSEEDPTPYSGAGHRVSKVDIITRGVTTFAINRSGFPAAITREGGFGRPVEVQFGPDGAMYILDMGTNLPDQLDFFIPNTGVIWRITPT